MHADAEELLFTAVACECRPNTLVWCSTTSYILFASPRTICIVEPSSESQIQPQYRIIGTVEKAHSGEINSLTGIRCANDSKRVRPLFCSASSSGEVAIWKLLKKPTNTSAEDGQSHMVLIKRINKKSSIELAKIASCGWIDGRTGNEQILLATLQFDHIDVQFLNLNGAEIGVAAVPSLNFHNSIPSTFELSHIYGAILLAVGLSNGMIDIFVSEQESYSIQKKFSLDLCGTNKSWTRALAFKHFAAADDRDDQFCCLSLAAASDGLIKIWKFDGGKEKALSTDDNQLKMHQQTFYIKNGHIQPIAVTLDSVLHGQTEPIYSLAWHPNNAELLSSGANQTVVRWSYSDTDSIWFPISRFGEIVGDGVNCYDITYSPCGQFALCHSFLGGFHFWKIGSKGVFPKCFSIGGHFAEVTDLCWEPNGSFLLTCASDMTTRIFANHKQFDFFFEIARPQTHGHPINCLTSVNRDLFVSGSEEKIFRVFQATSSFAQNLATFSGQQQTSKDSAADQNFSRLPISAAFQTELTLTNKAVTEFDGGRDGVEDGGGCGMADSLLFTEPPREDQLSKLTLFPEQHKLYGHGFEVFSCASSHNGKILATSCKASHFEHAAIILWDTYTWKQMNTLKAHQLTVTRLSFSYDDKFLLSVSRDRTWTLFHRANDNYELFQRAEKAHGRIIWDCAWCPDAHLFATCSRDKALKLWTISGGIGGGGGEQQIGQVMNTTTFVGDEALTAVDFAPKKIGESYLVAIGFENGAISLLKYNPTSNVLQLFTEFSTNSAHSGRINRLRFRPLADKEKMSDDFLVLASCDAFSVKIHKIK